MFLWFEITVKCTPGCISPASPTDCLIDWLQAAYLLSFLCLLCLPASTCPVANYTTRQQISTQLSVAATYTKSRVMRVSACRVKIIPYLIRVLGSEQIEQLLSQSTASSSTGAHGAGALLEDMERSQWRSCFLGAHRATRLEYREQLPPRVCFRFLGGD